MTEQPLTNIPTGIFYINYFDEITDGKVPGLMALCVDVLALAAGFSKITVPTR